MLIDEARMALDERGIDNPDALVELAGADVVAAWVRWYDGKRGRGEEVTARLLAKRIREGGEAPGSRPTSTSSDPSAWTFSDWHRWSVRTYPDLPAAYIVGAAQVLKRSLGRLPNQEELFAHLRAQMANGRIHPTREERRRIGDRREA